MSFDKFYKIHFSKNLTNFLKEKTRNDFKIFYKKKIHLKIHFAKIEMKLSDRISPRKTRSSLKR